MEKRVFEIGYDSNMITIGNICDLSMKDDIDKLKEFIEISIKCNIAKYRTFVSAFKVTFIDDEKYEKKLNDFLNSSEFLDCE
jgi:hypothetical protein